MNEKISSPSKVSKASASSAVAIKEPVREKSSRIKSKNIAHVDAIEKKPETIAQMVMKKTSK